MSLSAGFAESEHGPVWTTASIIGSMARVTGLAATPASTAWPANNQAVLIPFLVPGQVTITGLFFEAGTTPGTANYDLGVYNDTFGRLASLGATAAVNTTDAILPVGGGTLTAPLTLPRGRYYLAMSAAATTITVHACAPANGVVRMYGLQQMATAHPLPTTVTPVSMGATAFVPTLGMMTTATIL